MLGISLSKSLKIASVGVGIAIVLVIVYFIYQRFIVSKPGSFQENNEYVSDSIQKGIPVELTMWGVPWCPHSKRAKPIWEGFAKQVDGTMINGYEIVTQYVDCEDEPAKCSEANIDGYPTITALRDGKTFKLEESVSDKTLEAFLEKVCQ